MVETISRRGATVVQWLAASAASALVVASCATVNEATSVRITSTTTTRQAPLDSMVTTELSSTTMALTADVVDPTDAPVAPHSLPIDGDWTVTNLDWPVQPFCCNAPAVGPASPAAAIPTDGQMPADGFYDVAVTRTWDPPGVIEVTLRRWVSCAESLDSCPADSPDGGVFADPATEVETHLELNENLTVVIEPLQAWDEGRYPDPPQVITGSGLAFYDLLSGWCSGYIPERNTENCGIDHAFPDWIWLPYQAGASIEQIIADLRSADTGPTFPFTEFDDHADDQPCTGYRCTTAYRGPQGTHLIIDFTLLGLGGNWLDRLYGWWTSLEVRNGKPILYIDAGRLFG